MKAALNFHRRLIIKYFGSYRSFFIWMFSVFITVVLLDRYVFYPTLEDTSHYEDGKVSTHRNVSCGEVKSCPAGQYSFQIVAGIGRENHPYICFNGKEVFSPKLKNGKRGINLASINGKNREVEDVRTFDTYEEDTIFQRYFRLGVESDNIIMMATNDEATTHLTDESRTLITQFGSKLISNLGFRDSFVMIGQKNLKPPAVVIEKMLKRNYKDDFAPPASIKGCVSIPMGSQSESHAPDKKDELETALLTGQVKVGDFSPNCGLEKECPQEHYPLRINTGKHNTIFPSVCFKSKYVLGEKLNNPVRGITIGVINTMVGEVTRIEGFDTYANKDNSEKLVTFLDGVKENEMIFALAYDEAHTTLTPKARTALTSFGSSFITTLAFRDVWVLVGKPKMDGYSPYEDIESAGKGSWPFPIDAKFCVEKKFVGTKDKMNLELKKNLKKREFCKKYDGYEEFCAKEDIDKHPEVITQTEESMKKHAIYNVPIVIVPGLSQVSLMKQLAALFLNPAMNVAMINVMYDEKLTESEMVSQLYKVNTTKLHSSTKYNKLIHLALEEVWKKYPQSDSVILLEEEVIPTNDLLFFLGQCLSVVQSDETLAGVSAFNENGFTDLSSEPTLVYRGKTFPGFGLLLKKSFYQKVLKDKMVECCSNRAWFSWDLPDTYEVLYPDVSRVSRRHYIGLTEHASFLRMYLNSPRNVYKLLNFTKLSGLDNLEKTGYTKMTNHVLSKATVIPNNLLVKCLNNNIKLQLTCDRTHVVYYERSVISPTSLDKGLSGNRVEKDPLLIKLATCFELSYSQYSHVRGKHEETLRFQYKKSQVMLVSDASPFYKSKLTNQSPFTEQLL